MIVSCVKLFSGTLVLYFNFVLRLFLIGSLQVESKDYESSGTVLRVN
jgi:hypothetical protein